MIRYAVLAALALIALALCNRRVRHALKLIWRFATGEPMDGRPRSDAGWGRPGTKALTVTGHCPRWYLLRREIRAGVRLGLVLGGLGVAYGLVAAWAATVAALEGAAAATIAASSALGVLAALTVQSGRAWVRPAHVGLGAVGGVAYRAALNWSHSRRYVRPLHLALGELVGVPRSVRARSWIDLPRDFATRPGAKIVAKLPQGFALTADVSRQVIADATCAVLGLEHVSHKWSLAGAHPRVTFTTHAPPPDKVRLADVRELLGKLADTALLVGLGRGRSPVTWDQSADSPHMCLSCGSGGGKSATARAIIAQHLRRGGVVLVLDIKRLSHAYLRGCPNARVCRSIAEIHDGLLWAQGELDRRNALADEGATIDGETDHVDIGARLLVVVEELNSTAARLVKHWAKIKTKDDPRQSPALEALGDLLFLGRQVRCNALVIAQYLSARSVGSPEARENIGTRALGRFTWNNWRALCPESWPPPRSSRHPGRLQIAVAGQVKETQALFLTPAEAREYALGGVVTPFPSFTAPVMGGDGATGTPPTIEGVPLVNLRQAADSLGLGLAALRSARARDPEFPAAREQGGPGGEHQYALGDLERWQRDRPRAGAA